MKSRGVRRCGIYVYRRAVPLVILWPDDQMEAKMDVQNVDRSLAKLGVTRPTRKRASHSPKLKVAAALVPLLAAAAVAARKIARRNA